jgi:5-formyltetrahydrofolate cyclo-ligase
MVRSEKSELRREMRARRRSLDAPAQHRAAVNLARRLERLNVFGPCRRVAFYIASDGEIDPGPAMRLAADAGTTCLVPVIPGKGRRRLRFARWCDGTPMNPNRFGIPEPDVCPTSLLTALHLDLILMPLVAFDLSGNRLGMGGGFYDSTLAMRAGCRFFRRPSIIGLAHECQRLDRLETEPWDVPVDRIVTDCRVYGFRTGQA